VTIVRFLAEDVRKRLTEVHADLTPEIFREALVRGEIGRNSCSALDPGPLVGMTRWGRTIRGLREQVLATKWTMKERPQSLTISPDARVAVAVATGTAATGNKDASPTTKWLKGAATAQAIKTNKSLYLFPDMAPTEEQERLKAQEYNTWVLLFRRVLVKADTGEPLPVDDPTDIISVGDVEIEQQAANDDGLLDDDNETDGAEDVAEEDSSAEATRAVILCEFSLPNGYTVVESRYGKRSVRITKWHERLLLERVDVTELVMPDIERKGEPGHDVDIQVVRRK
jgi:hypothetical protein